MTLPFHRYEVVGDVVRTNPTGCLSYYQAKKRLLQTFLKTLNSAYYVSLKVLKINSLQVFFFVFFGWKLCYAAEYEILGLLIHWLKLDSDFNLRLGTKQHSNILHLGSTNQEALSTILRMTPKNQQIVHFSMAVWISFFIFYAFEEMMYILYSSIFLCIFLNTYCIPIF